MRPERNPHQPADARGASLASVLVLVVVLGGLAATAVVGVNAMTGSDSVTSVLPTTTTITPKAGGGGPARVGLGGPVAQAAAAACQANATAANAASSAYFANSSGTYPTKWSDLTASSPPTFALAEHVVISPGNPAELDGNGWKLLMSGGGTTAPTFACK